MAKRKIEWIKGEYYHLYNRGAHRQSIFREEENYAFVIRKLQKYREELNVAVIVYCLMPNHYHFVVRQDGDHSAGLLAQRIFNSYTKAYNGRYDHSGTLFEGPYEAKHIGNDEYLSHLCRYIHANPVKDKITTMLEMWPFSNYPDWIGERDGTLLEQDFIDAFFPDMSRYKSWVMDYLRTRELPDALLAYLQGLEER